MTLSEAQNALYGVNGHSVFETSNVKEVVEHASSHIDLLES